MEPTLRLRGIIEHLRGEGGFAFLSRARELREKGKPVVNLSIGQPDVPTPDPVIEEAVKALTEEKFTGYTETPGIPEIRKAIAEYLNERYGADVDWEEVVVTPGTKGAIFLALSAYLDSGDEIIVPEPSYPAYPEGAKILGGKPVYIPLEWRGPSKGFGLDLEKIEEAITPRTKFIVVNNPQNPTGALFSPKELEELVEIARRHNVMILADEIYDNFIYDGAEFKSLISLPDWREWLVYTNGFSKTFSMTGWRLGYVVVRRDVARLLSKIAVSLWGCPVSFAQKAAVRALRDPEVWKWVEKLSRRYGEMRRILYEELSKTPGVEVHLSKGAYYLFPYVKKVEEETGLTTEEIVDYIIDNYYLIILPGGVFPDKAGKDFIRFSFATSREAVSEGGKRFREAITKLLEEKSHR